MNCNEIRELLCTAYSDGQLTPTQVALLDEHCHACAACRDALHAAQEVRTAFQHASPQVRVPDTVWATVTARIAEEHHTTLAVRWSDFVDTIRHLGTGLRPAVAYAMVIGVIAVGVVTGQLHSLLQSRVASNSAVIVLSHDLGHIGQEPIDNFGTYIEQYFL